MVVWRVWQQRRRLQQCHLKGMALMEGLRPHAGPMLPVDREGPVAARVMAGRRDADVVHVPRALAWP